MQKIIEIALNSIQLGDFNVEHNHPFKGGHLTRSKGKPSNGIHALQLEMSKDLYMQNKETVYDVEKAIKIKTVLKQTFTQLISYLHE